ncbi:citrate lyase acyl carrier protein [Treponema phagedenis]|uniref:Citrate lyase acyl carrier protein n=1 Tax=Treponema phagedenis TaxID=162 RepID=A0A0B7GXZ5_TREPH|nr:citrate lyase acyl carrier protein [Treponema phagedenis]NVP22878.1 citrate lyase acyl carrier protein [Treponema phagedenis]QEJ94952.1 citrate lyase acyl carrier protein [Treponema phagedenis]QEJ98319.1 citrate lyase acyl carrier protein [Treponema phagedenis]QEK00855.1 citrate lyase acyl carrier protein [Treponema phagedenis]QEK03829.1 citrate lyase acyl carrier protein [Treponema phagedenis]
MQLKTTGVAGTLESSDVMITVEPAKNGISIELTSSVEKQFGRQIKELILKVTKELGVTAAFIKVADKGAIDYVLTARLKAACYRAAERTDYQWEG